MIAHAAEAALGVGVSERICANREADGGFWFDADGQVKHGFGGFGWQVRGNGENGVFVGRLDFRYPGGRNAIAE